MSIYRCLSPFSGYSSNIYTWIGKTDPSRLLLGRWRHLSIRTIAHVVNFENLLSRPGNIYCEKSLYSVYFSNTKTSVSRNRSIFSSRLSRVNALYYSSSTNGSKFDQFMPHKVKKRVQKKKKENTNDQPEQGFVVRAFSTAEEYNLKALLEILQVRGVYVLDKEIIHHDEDNTSENLFDQENILHLTAVYQLTEEVREIYIFREGSIVFWNIPKLEQHNFFDLLKPYEINGYAVDVAREESENLYYSYSFSPTKIKLKQNTICFNKNGDLSLEKYAVSNALAMSVKLGMWEASLDNYIENIEHVSEILHKKGKVTLGQEEILQKLGKLFALRHVINLSSDLLDTPDFYWDRDQLEELYNRISNHLSIKSRTTVMNLKLNHCIELMELLKGHLNEKHSAKLEWIIIILIMIEVFFEVLHFL